MRITALFLFFFFLLSACVSGNGRKRDDQLYRYEPSATQLLGVPAVSRLETSVAVTGTVVMENALDQVPNGLRVKVTTPRKNVFWFPVSRYGRIELGGLEEKGTYTLEAKQGGFQGSSEFEITGLNPAPVRLMLRKR